MGSKSPEKKHQWQDADSTQAPKPKVVPNPNSARIAGHSTGERDGNGESDDDDDDDREKASQVITSVEPADKKKKKRNRAKKTKKKAGASSAPAQSSPPRVLLSTLFPSGNYPKGEFLKYNENLSRTTGEELRYLDRMNHFDDEFLKDYRQAAEVHRQVRQWSQQHIKPGQSLMSIAEEIEDGMRALTGHQDLEEGDGLKAGMAFPTGLCLNNVGAHYTPNPSDGNKVVLQYDDVMKVDFGVHVNGRIVDSAYTMAFNPVYDNLLASVKDATNTGVKAAGIDARMSDIGASIQEVMESYEVEINGKTFPVKAIRSITGHDIKRYRIHGDKQVPFVENSSNVKMEEGEVFAIETFGTTGRGYLWDDTGIYGYGRNPYVPVPNLHLSSAKSLLKDIDKNFGTLVFCRRYLERLGVKKYLLGMNNLISSGVIESYAPLVDIKGSYIAQFEHVRFSRFMPFLSRI
ncbi:methionine aminopeptidase, type II [Helicocarpus griseus UAMH5409]|uniref:Methionine aminopeptidase 2 n=1 Tax=Helicocarpus griseus UAMH5409 TaxID=1447875 RepID=A0A2B7X7C6_9EURO|nr:methionine aminopeptidase, type II [Helicocarpus griseus UAMH5409]